MPCPTQHRENKVALPLFCALQVPLPLWHDYKLIVFLALLSRSFAQHRSLYQQSHTHSLDTFLFEFSSSFITGRIAIMRIRPKLTNVNSANSCSYRDPLVPYFANFHHMPRRSRKVRSQFDRSFCNFSVGAARIAWICLLRLA